MKFNSNMSINEIEREILKFWKDNKCFEKSNEISKNRKQYTFYDGPPFATGLPHFGHILSGTVKDIVTRYVYQHGYHVDRRFGWDCHGLPVEFEIDKLLGINQKSQILKMGVDKYNAECKSIVMKYSSEWKGTVEKMGRWVDFDNSYKTMDLDFMTSVWYIFKMLFSKGYVYRGYRVMPFSTGCMTTLSNSEAKSNYKIVNDLSVVVAFPLKDKLFNKEVSLLAWTTTPWTLPSNCGLIVNSEFNYQIFEMNGKFYAMLENKIDEFFKDKISKHEIFKGEILKDMQYEQPFSYFEKHRSDGFFKVLIGSFVSSEDGTGIVHAAPAFGEEDYNCFVENKVIRQNDLVPCPVDENGNFTKEVTDFEGIYVKDADKKIIKFLKDKILLTKQISHSYPFCWRSEKPLIYKLVPSWFIRVTDSIEKLLKNNEFINWVPGDIKHKKFGAWLSNAKDWAISRTRFWGTPIPLWVSDDFSEIICVGSAEELSKLSGREITDLHMEFIDDIILEKNGKKLRRISEVFDCWFESGSMPYAQNNWPFNVKHKFNLDLLKKEISKEENLNNLELGNLKDSESGTKKDLENFKHSELATKKDLENFSNLELGYNKDFVIYEDKILENFPADFIGEGIDQTRGWFYNLHVISTLLFDKPAFKNVIVNGIVLAENGKKMSKKDKNYPDPNIVMDKYGSDSLRMYLVSSPVVEAENLLFKESGVKEISKTLIIPWMNVLKFYTESSTEKNINSELELDSWIIYKFEYFLANVTNLMNKYELSKVCILALDFIDDLSNWYLRIHREEIRSGNTKVLCKLLKNFSIVMAPFTPFFSEYCYQSILKSEEIKSVHFEMYPEIKQEGNKSFDKSKNIIDSIRYLRDKHTISLKTPLKNVKIVCDLKFEIEAKKYFNTIMKECHLLSLEFNREEDMNSLLIEYKAKPCFEHLKKDLKTMKEKIKKISKLKQEELKILSNLQDEDISFDLLRKDVIIEKNASYPVGLCMAMSEFVILVDNSVDENVLEKKTAREFNSFIQKLRKACGLKMEDTVQVEIDNEYVKQATLKYYNIIFGLEGRVVNSSLSEGSEDCFSYENKNYKVTLRIK